MGRPFEDEILGDVAQLVGVLGAPWNCDHANVGLDEAHLLAQSLVDADGFAARVAGWIVADTDEHGITIVLPAERSPEGVEAVEFDWASAREAFGGAAEELAPTSHTQVTETLATALEARGEVVTDLAGIWVWTRPLSRSTAIPEPIDDPVLVRLAIAGKGKLPGGA